MAPKFKLTRFFQLADKMLEGKVPISFLYVAQLVVKPSIKENLNILQAKLKVDTIAIFDEDNLKKTNINSSSEVPLAIKIEFLSNIIAKPTQENQNLHLRIIQLINDNNVLLVRCTSSNMTYATSLLNMMDYWNSIYYD